MSKIKLSKVVVGLSVVVNDLEDATIYQVSEVNGFTVSLTYKLGNGDVVSGGAVDYTCLQLPTKKQIANFEKDLAISA